MPFKKLNDQGQLSIMYPREDQFEYSQAYLTRNRRMLFLRGPILDAPTRNDSSGPTWIGDDLLALTLDDPSKPIYIFVSSGGGDIASGLMLFDKIRLCPANVITITENAASMGTIIASAGDKRLCMPHSRFMLHLPSAAFQGSEAEIDIQSKLLTNLKNDLIDCYIDRGVTAGLKGGKENDRNEIRKKILKDIAVMKWMNAEDAIAYGLVDEIITTTELFGVT